MYRTHYISEAKNLIGSEVTIAGWLHEIRDLGKMKFLQIRDRTGIIQVFAKQGMVPDAVMALMSQPKETVVCVKGKVAASKIAEAKCELIPTEFTILNEITMKVPFEVTGKVPVDLEVR
ncbi:MAG: OB-fold nucleic acid binding domain-containing protein, partial [Candidatus Micrarchaeota archaeon]|nr:OB-fold nucleic acid binding domain-containing protein [Candidatus Micrarchaeota archaeon]